MWYFLINLHDPNLSVICNNNFTFSIGIYNNCTLRKCQTESIGTNKREDVEKNNVTIPMIVF